MKTNTVTTIQHKNLQHWLTIRVRQNCVKNIDGNAMTPDVHEKMFRVKKTIIKIVFKMFEIFLYNIIVQN